MATFQMIIIVIIILIAGAIGLMFALQSAQYFMGRPISIRKIFDGLKAKIWMTAGVGIFFFIFYATIVLIGTNYINSEIRIKIFYLMRKDPILFVYLGLVLFVTTSLSILVVRSIIKRIYNSRG
ncbi:MAG: hypothetical protein H0W50_11630 [Parachlamydiaceae bacterium]|nr:hypothetical protein [Parachlamydiaceae bacterium]